MSKTGKPTKEYKVITLSSDDSIAEAILNQFTREGWRLVPIVLGYFSTGAATVLFERGKYVE